MAARNRLRVRRYTAPGQAPAAPGAPGYQPPAPGKSSYLYNPRFAYERQQEQVEKGIGFAEQRFLTEGVKSVEAVRGLQSFLNTRGFKLAADGRYGPQTERAYQQYREQYAQSQQQISDNLRNAGLQQEEAAAAEAAKARAYFQKIADQQKGDLARQIGTLADPNRVSNLKVVDAYKKAQADAKAQAAELKRKSQQRGALYNLNPHHFKVGRALKATGINALGLAGNATDEFLQQAYYAGKRSQLQGGSSLDQARATLGGLPGLGFIAGHGKARRAVEDVNSRQERERLTRKGQLASFGEFVTGNAASRLKGAALQEFEQHGGFLGTQARHAPTPLRGALSGSLDAAFQVFSDPTTYLTGGLKSLAKPLETAAEAGIRSAARDAGLKWYKLSTGALRKSLGDEAAEQAERLGRRVFVEGRVGKSVLDVGAEALAKNRDATALTKALKGLPGPVAADAVEAARKGGLDAGKKVLEKALVEREWNPTLHFIRNQVLGGRVPGLAASGALRAEQRLAPLRRFVRGAESDAATISTRAENVALQHALETSLQRAGTFAPDFAQKVGAQTANLDHIDRLNKVWSFAQSTGNAAYEDSVAKEISRVFKAAGTTARTQLPPEAERVLARLEMVSAVLRGEAGEAARVRAELELSKGLVAPTRTAARVVEDAAGNVGLKLPKATKVSEATAKELKQQVAALPSELRGKFEDALAAAEKKNGKGLGRIQRSIEALKDKDVLDEAKRLAANEPKRAEQAVVEGGRRGFTAASPVRGLGRVALSIAESGAPRSVALTSSKYERISMANRSEAIDRWAAALGADELTASQLRIAAEAARSEKDLYAIAANTLKIVADQAGVDPQELIAILNEKLGFAAKKRAFAVDAAGNLIRDPQVITQNIQEIPLVDPDTIARKIRELRAAGGDRFAKARLSASAIGDFKLLPSVENSTLRDLLIKGHRAWKFAVVTNLYAPAIGFTAGAVSGEGDLGDRLKQGAKFGAIGFGIGAFGSVRYILRVAGTEERMRTLLERGFRPVEWVPGVAKWWRTRGVDIPFAGEDLVRAGSRLGAHLEHPLLVSVDDGFVALAKKKPRFVDSWWRIVNHQIHPESDQVTQLLLTHRAGQLTEKELNTAIAKFLKTDDGKLWLSRLKGKGGPKNAAEAVARYRTFIDTHIPTAEMAELRLAGEVDREFLKGALDAAPDVIHAQATWVIPKSGHELAVTKQNLAQRLVLEGPTSRLNRIPMAEQIYKDEYLALRKAGIEPERAAELAEDMAVRRTNEIMFQVNDESRFARKVDFVFPFQQPREELVRVWGKLALRNPGRTFRATRLAAVAFNNGVDSGVFRKDEMSGNWYLSVPGSGFLGARLHGVNPSFNANLKDMLFFAQGAFGLNVLPTPGGPYWTTLTRLFVTHNQDFYENLDPRVKQLLFPYGASGRLFRAETSRLHMGMVGSPPPWEFASQFEQENEWRRWQKEIYLQLQWQHYHDTGELDYEPTEDEVNNATKDFFKVWAFVGSVFPAAPHPVFPSQKAFQLAKSYYADANGKLSNDNRKAFLEEQPQFTSFMTSRSEYIGPDDMKHWTKEGENRAEEATLHYRKQKSLAQFKKELAENRRTAEAYAERNQILLNNDPYAKEAELEEWRRKHPDLAGSSREAYFRDQELVQILNGTRKSQQDVAIDKWRKRYGVSHQQYVRLRDNAKNFRYNPWRAARDPEDIAADVERHERKGFDGRVYVNSLPAAEQIRYWQHKRAELQYYRGENDPHEVVAEHNRINKNIADIFKENETFLSKPKKKSPWEQTVQQYKESYTKQVSAAYTEISQVRDAMDKAREGKDRKTYFALKAKRDALYDHVRELKNAAYRQLPDEAALAQEEVYAVFALVQKGSVAEMLSVLNRQGSGDIPFVPSNEEQHYLSMSDPVKQAYVDDLVNRLNTESGQKGKLFYEWLTDFQKDLLDSNLPEDLVNTWKVQHPDASGTGGGGREFWGHKIGDGGGELAFAIEMFKQYSKRAPGAEPPASYKEYLTLPADPIVRADFLRKHPDAAKWIKDGAMANMPIVIRMLVTNIMLKYGKWEPKDGDGVKTIQEITDVAFAREQLARWNKRPSDGKPAAYDVWLNMPTGPAKAEFLKSHPEVQDWIRLGPMAQMPDEYQSVVRDIMVRYGEWTQNQDPLGEVIAGYYKVPKGNREQYLNQHPELREYWAALRSPQENAMQQLADRYFSIPEPTARRGFLQSHPELEQWFLDQRTKRYEKFVAQVAQYMGQNPELFQQYLSRQTDILGEMLHRLNATPALLREVPRLRQQYEGNRTQRERAVAV